MQILIPDVCIPNTYVCDLAFALSELGHEIIWNSDNLFYSSIKPDAIVSQWAEGYFRKPGEIEKLQSEQLDILEYNLKKWSKQSPIISFVHNVEPRPRGNPALDTKLKRLFQLNYGLARGFVHLGKQSIIDFEKYYQKDIYQDKPRLVISHGLNELLKKQYPPKERSRDNNNSFRIFVPGAIRYGSELNLLIRAFIKAKIPNKQLIIGGKGYVFEYSVVRFFLGIAINRIPQISIYGRKLSDREMTDELVDADIVISPRIQATNSGIPYLAATYGKRCIAPNVGNLPEAVSELNGLLFDPREITSLTMTMEQAYHEKDTIKLPDSPCPSWHEIALKIEQFIISLKS